MSSSGQPPQRLDGLGGSAVTGLQGPAATQEPGKSRRWGRADDEAARQVTSYEALLLNDQSDFLEKYQSVYS